jgi:NADH dehydrogenase
MSRRVVLTGAFSYTGAAVAGELLRRGGYAIHTLTNRRPPPGADEAITIAPLRFERGHLVEQLAGAEVLVNTFWVRLPHAGQTFETAVEASRLLFDAAAAAGVQRIVHVSVSNAAAGTNLGYYRGKAEVEAALRRQRGPSWAIVRPTLVVGPGDVLTNNIAWFLRRFPVFPMPDGGRCRLQPVTLADTARIICDALEAPDDGLELDAAGPEILTFAGYVRLVARACGVRRWFLSVPGWLSLALLRLVGLVLRDVVLTREELLGLEQDLLLSHAPPTGQQSVRAFLEEHGDALGRRYVNDLRRHFTAGRDRAVLDHRRLGASATLEGG